jgi:SAM-dependent methyltransferase
MPLRTRLARSIATLPPPLRWRARNAIALARWLRVRRGAASASDGYADGFWDLHSGGDWTGFADAVLRFCRPASVVDVGCGDGKLLAALRARSAMLPILGVDSSRAALGRAVAAGVPVAHYDLASTRGVDVQPLRAQIAGFDLVVSLETAEHLPPWAAASFVETLTRARTVVFSAAQPDQGGTLHMNERPPEYWRARFAARGFRPAPFDAAFRAAVAALALPWWYAANVHVFERAS